MVRLLNDQKRNDVARFKQRLLHTRRGAFLVKFLVKKLGWRLQKRGWRARRGRTSQADKFANTHERETDHTRRHDGTSRILIVTNNAFGGTAFVPDDRGVPLSSTPPHALSRLAPRADARWCDAVMMDPARPTRSGNPGENREYRAQARSRIWPVLGVLRRVCHASPALRGRRPRRRCRAQSTSPRLGPAVRAPHPAPPRSRGAA